MILILLLTFVIVMLLILYRKKRILLNTVPGPKCIPILGNFININMNYHDAIKTIRDLQNKYGDVVRIEFGPVVAYFVRDKVLINKILSGRQHFLKPEMYTKFSKSWLGSSLIITSGDKWKKLRKLDSSSFTHKNLEGTLYSINVHCQIFTKTLEQHYCGDSFNLNKITEKFVVDIFCSAMLKFDAFTQSISNDIYWCSVVMFDVMMKRMWSILYKIDWIYKLTDEYQLEKKSSTLFRRILKDAVQERRKILFEEVTHEKTFALIDNLVIDAQYDASLTDEIICDEIGTFMVAGVDTIAALIKFTLYELSLNVHIQNKIVEELKVIFEDDFTRDITLKDTQSMHYLSMVTKETLRKYAAAPLVGRVLSEDVQYGKMKLLKNSIFFLCVHEMHNYSKYFPNPEIFDPQRFSSENTIDSMAYIPFTSGPRICIGKQFGTMASHVILASILRKFEVLPAYPKQELNLVMEGVLGSLNGIHIRLKKR